MKLQTENGFVHLVCAYEPTLHAEEDTKDLFYSHLETVVKEIPNSDQILLLGTFNAHTGSDTGDLANTYIKMFIKIISIKKKTTCYWRSLILKELNA